MPSRRRRRPHIRKRKGEPCLIRSPFPRFSTGGRPCLCHDLGVAHTIQTAVHPDRNTTQYIRYPWILSDCLHVRTYATPNVPRSSTAVRAANLPKCSSTREHSFSTTARDQSATVRAASTSILCATARSAVASGRRPCTSRANWCVAHAPARPTRPRCRPLTSPSGRHPDCLGAPAPVRRQGNRLHRCQPRQPRQRALSAYAEASSGASGELPDFDRRLLGPVVIKVG